MLTYNKDVHSATGLTPNEARKEKNEFKAKLNVSVKARKEKMYPTLGGRQGKSNEEESNYREGENKGQKYYTLEGFNRPLLRHELLKL